MATRMKSLAPAPEAVLAAVRRAEPSLPPAQIDPADPAYALNIRARASTMAAIEAEAQESGRTMKQVIMEALRAAGVAVAAIDLEDRSPARRRKR